MVEQDEEGSLKAKEVSVVLREHTNTPKTRSGGER